ncbi:MAG: aminopeptidase P family protein [Desulfobulbaceae bacterium]|nr:MAG: aminopeptidase P family protein [Desulfobulbaceae bacterium]
MKEYFKSTPAEELQQRITFLREELKRHDIDAALIIQKTDFFYYSGTAQQGWLYVPVEGSVLLMIAKDYQRALSESGLKNVVFVASPKKIPEVISEYGLATPAKLGMELDVVPVNLCNQYQKLFPESQLVDISHQIRVQRSIKSDYEIELIREAARCSDKIAARIPDLLQEGVTEVALAGEIESYARSLGHQGIVRMRLWGSELFYGHVMSGSGAAIPSYLASPTGGDGVSPVVAQGAGFKKIRRNEPVLVDFVFAWQGYLSDHTRIFAIGELDDELQSAHEAMLEIQERTMKAAVPGVRSGDLYEQMLQSAEEKGFGPQFMGDGERKIRFTGHGIGLELDEYPFIAKGQQMTLAEGMIIALEPKAIFAGKGVVGIENTHVVTSQGLEPLGQISDRITYLE